MKAWSVIMLAALVIVVASAASATSITCAITTAGNLTTYNYTLTCYEGGDPLTALHVFAPLDLNLINGWTAPDNWLFDAVLDPDPTVGADIYWYADDYETHGLGDGSVEQFSLTVPSSCGVNSHHEVPGCFGNWGYENKSMPENVTVAYGYVPVPTSCVAPAVPEPASLLVLSLGCGIVARFRRKTR